MAKIVHFVHELPTGQQQPENQGERVGYFVIRAAFPSTVINMAVYNVVPQTQCPEVKPLG